LTKILKLFQVRFAVNCVINRDFDRPLNISNFIAEVNAGFRLLNLKNDSLRKRFDVLKYDVKRIEEVRRINNCTDILMYTMEMLILFFLSSDCV